MERVATSSYFFKKCYLSVEKDFKSDYINL